MGLLFLIEDYKDYGSMTNTLTKFVLIIDGSSNASNDSIKDVLSTIQRLYTNEVMNPFYEIGNKSMPHILNSLSSRWFR